MTTDEKLDLLIEKVSSLDAKVSSLDARVSALETSQNNMQLSMNDMQSSIDKIEKDVSGIKCTLEGEINYNIKLIAEGHGYVNEHSSEALQIAHQVKGTQELQDIRLNIIEGEIKRIQQALQSA